MRNKPLGQGERLIKFLSGGTVGSRFNIFLFIAVIFFSRG